VQVERLEIYDFKVVLTEDEFDAFKLAADNGDITVEELLVLSIAKGLEFIISH